MIRLRDTYTLAFTKLRTRKVRLGITIVISGLLFGALVAGSLVTRGAFDSIASFTKEGFGERYVVKATSQPQFTLFNNQEIKDRAMVLFNEMVAKKKIEAKKLGIEYDPATEAKPVDKMGSESDTYINPTHPSALQAIKEYNATHPGNNNATTFRKQGEAYGASLFYTNRWSTVQNGDQIEVLKDGKEDFTKENLKQYQEGPNGLDAFVSQWGAMSDELLKTFILPGENLQTGSDGSIPIIVPFSAAQKFLKLDALPGSAPSEEKLERMKYVRENLKNTTYQACFRNQGSSALIQEATSAEREIAANKGKKDYKKPELQYGYPTEPCGASPVIRDVRSSETKKLAAKQLQFAEMFGQEPPKQEKLTFRVVGVSPDMNIGNFSRIDQIFNSIVQSTLGNGWFMPQSQIATKPVLERAFPVGSPVQFRSDEFFAEFSSAKQEQVFLDEASCTGYDSLACAKEGKPFMLEPFGSNSIATASLKQKADKAMNIAALGVIIVAAVIMMGTVGRMIADSRRETAVFRAIGAKRIDISMIYVLYTLLLSLLIAGFAFLVGMLVASIVNDRFSAALTAQALVAYNAQDLSRNFTLFGVHAIDLLRILACVLLAGLISSILPLLRNVRRNPIRDMRDEN